MIKKTFIIIFFFFMWSGTDFTYAQTLKAYLAAGDNSMEKSRYAEAIEYYLKALEFETDNPTISYKMAEASRLYKDYERAAAWYGKIVMGDKENRYPDALFRFAEMKKYLGRYEESHRLYERYIRNNPLDTGYTGIKSRKEVADSAKIAEIANRKIEVEVKNAGTPVNSIYSEFGASMMGDSLLYFSSLKFLYEQTEKKEDAYYVSRILTASPQSSKNTQPLPLSIIINEASTHNGNSAFTPDYRVMVFSRCSQPEGIYELDCELYISRFEDGRFGKPEKIGSDVNIKGFSSTQPALEARGAEGYTLYFVSDRPGGHGKLDIWKSDFNANLEFSKSENLGPVVNSFDDEMTPFFDTPNRTLYFSSYGHAGMGGMDIFKSVNVNGTFTEPENLGPGYNTPVNDVYYTLNGDGKSGTLSSNRPGSMFIKSKTCCYDIYFYNIPQPDTTVATEPDTIPLAVITEEDENDPGGKAYYDDFLPLELYFDNDEPDKRTLAVTTNKSYDKLYYDYIARKEEYKLKFAGNLSDDDKAKAETKITTFFDNIVTGSWNRLNGFCEKVERALNQDVDIELIVRGRASPLAETAYNINLSRRRISSLENFMKFYNSGALKPHFENGSLKIVEVAAGDSLAAEGVSDLLTDTRNSVYNPAAAIERRIELIDVNLKQPEK